MNAVQWGWKIVCAHPGCNGHVEFWDDEGYPSLPHAGAHAGGPLNGWFLYWPNYIEVQHLQYSAIIHPQGKRHYLNGHIAYCPKHAATATAWQAAFWDWQEKRREAKKNVAIPLLTRVRDFLNPKEAEYRVRGIIDTTMDAWYKSHPAPQPPWKL